MVRHIPNALTILRLLSVPLIVWLMAAGEMGWAFWLFIAAGITDAVDGAVARLCDARTRLGQWLDPLADKVMLVAVFITLGIAGHLPLWLVVLVVLRDLLIVLYALVYVVAGTFDGSPLFISKINTATQILSAAVVLGHLGQGWGGPMLVQAFIYAAGFTTIASGAVYLMAASRRLPPVGE